ncbi:MAG: hypothetical protein JSV15_03170, partial [Candidatus Bathyarchaeota archaeon]
RAIDKELEIAVSDTGIGIAEKDMRRIFQPFERIETQLKAKTGGTGLGLYLTKKIACTHGNPIPSIETKTLKFCPILSQQ